MSTMIEMLTADNYPMLIVALGMLGSAMLLTLLRLLIGPTIYDRILAMNVFGTLTTLLIALIGFVSGRPDFLDIALLYALINFVSTIAIIKFLRYQRLGRTSSSQEGKSDGVA